MSQNIAFKSCGTFHLNGMERPRNKVVKVRHGGMLLLMPWNMTFSDAECYT